MASASFVEIISHFAGYLRIFEDISRDRIEYDEGLAPRPTDDYTTLRPVYDHPLTPDDLETVAGPAPEPIADVADSPVHGHPTRAPAHPEDPDFDSPPPPRYPNVFLPASVGGGASGGGADFSIKVQYQHGGEQTELDVNQHNIMYDNSVVLPAGADFPLIARLDADALTTIQAMADDANAHIPSEWWIPQNGTGATRRTRTRSSPATT
jgi:hypothetical protein